METQEKMATEKVSVQGSDSSPATDELLHKQTRTRRLFTTPQLFAFTLVYFGTWYYVGANTYFAMQNGGPAGWLFSYLVVVSGVICQAASFAELASLQPVAGAQYYWTYHFAPPSLKMFLTWIQGWTTWLGYVSFLAGALSGAALFIEGLVALNHEDYVSGGWRTTVIIMGYLVFIAIANIYAFRAVPVLELVSGIVNFLLFFVVLVIMWVFSPRNNMDVFLIKYAASGWDNYFISFNIGSLSSVLLFLAFESMIHMGEETKNPRKAVPQALFWGICVNMVLGLLMVITFGICMPSIEALLESVSPLVTQLAYSIGSNKATTAIMALFIILGVAQNIATLASTSRLTWAWARDGGLPTYFAIVDAKTRVPLRAVLGTSLLVGLLELLNLSGESYVALSAISSLGGISLYISYSIILSCVIYARFATPGGIQLGEWNWGKAGLFFNVYALVYTLYEIIWLPFPNVLPVTALNFNYSGPIYVVVIAWAVSWWFLWARTHWNGPNHKIVEIVLREDERSK